MNIRWRRQIGRYTYVLYVLPSMRYLLIREMPADDDDDVVARGRALPGMNSVEIVRWVVEELREIADEMEKADELH